MEAHMAENCITKHEGLIREPLPTPTRNSGCEIPGHPLQAPRSNQGRRFKHAAGGGGKGGALGDLSPGVAALSSALCEVDLNRQHHLIGRSGSLPAAQLRTPPPPQQHHQQQQMCHKNSSSKSRAVSIGFERFLEWKAKQSSASNQQLPSCEGGAPSSSSSSPSRPSLAIHQSPGSAPVMPQCAPPKPLMESSLAPAAAAVAPRFESEETATLLPKDGDDEAVSSPFRDEAAEATTTVAERAQAATEEEEELPGPRWEGFDFDGADDEEEEDTRWKWGEADAGEDTYARQTDGGDVESLSASSATDGQQAEPQDNAVIEPVEVLQIGQQAADEGAGNGDRSKSVKWTLKLPVWPITLEVAVGVRRTISDPSEMPPRVPDPEAPPLYPPVSQLLRGYAGGAHGDVEAPALREVLEPPPFEVALAAAAARLSHWSSTVL